MREMTFGIHFLKALQNYPLIGIRENGLKKGRSETEASQGMSDYPGMVQ